MKISRSIRYISAALAVAGVVVLTEQRMETKAQVIDPCAASPANPVACENTLTGNPDTEWDISGAGDPSIQGFATDASVNRGETIRFKVSTPATSYRLDIYRLGYYAGMGARKVASIAVDTAQTQPACLVDAGTGLVDCGGWSESASWAVPATAVSGIYIGKLVRTDGPSGASHMIFVVRDDSGESDLLFQTSDTTWQAYNQYGGNSLYVGSPAGRAYKVSYNRPYTTRGTSPEDWVFNAEYPMVRWLEANGYNVSYTSGIDTDRRGSELLEHKVFLSVGHDEYWSGQQRANVEAARAAGVNLAFMSGNEIFWKTRYEPSIDGSSTPYRTLVSYKETHANAKIDPQPNVWTGTWRDDRFSPPADGGQPENALTGTIFMVNAGPGFQIEVPAAYGALRFWRNTTVASQAAGAVATLGDRTLGYEWDEAPANGFQPPGLIRLSSTTINVPNRLVDNGSTYGPGNATHNLTLYRDPDSQALVFGAGTVQWSWGLDGDHDRGDSTPDLRIQQATVNLFADMDALPLTPRPDLIVSSKSTDALPPSSAIVSPAQGAVLPVGAPVTISGTALDTGGTVAGVEVSTNGGATWLPATGRASWTFTWTPSLLGQTTIVSRAVDDSGNVELPVGGVGVTVTTSASISCPCTIWPDTTVPAVTDSGPDGAVELGVKFKSDISGYVTAIRFYKSTGNTGAHVGNLWTAAGQHLGSVTFVNETASGWQTAQLAAPIAVTANTTYVVSYHATAGHYAYGAGYFSASVDRGPLHALADSTSPNGVYRYGPTSAFPNQSYNASNYWVDVVFSETVVDTTAPVVTTTTPNAGGTAVAPPAALFAAFSEPMDAATITASTFTLRTSSGTPLAGSVTYDSTLQRAVFTPTAPLSYNAGYTATVEGGAAPRVTDVAGNPLAADYVWSFTTGAPPPPPPDQGPGGPILVVASPGNPFTRYYAEILRAEGLNAFAVADLGGVTSATLAGYDVVVLGEMPLTAAQVSMFTTWVNDGGQLIAMRPDKQLTSLLGIADDGATAADQYLLFDTAAGPGVGLVSQTIQYHGTADLYSVSGAASLATLYSTATAPRTNPAVTLRQLGASGGQAAAFTFDLARSIVYTRQGNPAWAGQDRDGLPPIRSDDLFYGGSVADWVDLGKVAIPQADELQRLFANLISQMAARRKPLPRFWYFPHDYKAVVVMTGDDHGTGGTTGRFDQYVAMSRPGCSVDDWECVRATSYVYPNTPIEETEAVGYRALGFELGVHISTGCADFTAATLPGMFTTQIADWRARFGALPSPVTNRTHCIVWSDYSTHPQVELANGIRLDTNYYYWPGSWLLDRPGLFTGSGLPMRFATTSGAMIDVYQAATYLTDESDETMPLHIATLLDNALGPNGFYGAFTANMHTDQVFSTGSDAILAGAQARNVPVISAEQLLTWVDGRNASAFRNLAWDGDTLTFSIDVGTGARGLRVLLPTRPGNGSLSLLELTAGGSPVAFTRETIKGIEYAAFPATSAAYAAVYDPGAPETAISAAPPQSSPSASATFQFTSTVAGSTFQCSRDGAPLAACTTPITYTGLAQGAHTFQVRAVAPSGTADPSPATFAWTIDATPPAITGVVVVPSETSAAVTWNTDELADSIVDVGTSASALTTRVSNPAPTLEHTVTLPNLSPGTVYYYRITSVNAVGLAASSPSATGASTFTTVAATPPDTTITASPAATTSSTSATFQFTASLTGSTFQCSRDGAAFAACTSPVTYSGLAAGSHTFSVKAIGSTGSADPTPATFTWTIDTTAPVISSVVVAPTQTSAVISWTTNEAADSIVDYGTSATSLTTRVSNAALVTTRSLTLSGLNPSTTYYYRVTSKNAAGLSASSPSATTASSFATPAIVVPNTTITSSPAAVTSSTGATFQFTSTVAGSTFQCARDGAAYAACTTPMTYSGLAAGSHTFSVRAVNMGVVDPTPATFSWTIDLTPPTVSGVTATPALTSAVITWATNEASDSVVEYSTSATAPVVKVSSASRVLNHSLTLTGLTASTTYYYRITSKNAAGLTAYHPSQTTTSSFVTRTQVAQTPSAAVIQTGSLRNNTPVANLGSNGGTFYQVNSTTSGTTRTAAWYGSFTGVSRSLKNLSVTYSGANSVSVTQTIEIWSWTKNAWVSLNSRTVGTTEVLISNLLPTGTLTNYVSTGGEVRVRVRCVGGSTSFYVNADWLQIAYDRP